MAENEPPAVSDILVRAAVAASPRFAGSLNILYEGFRDRWRSRASDVLELAATSLTGEQLSQRLADDPQLDALLVAALEAGSRTALERKRLLLGRVVNQAVLDDAAIDEAQLIVAVLAQIDAPHVRCLEAIDRAERIVKEAGRYPTRADLPEREIVPEVAEAGRVQSPPILAALSALGLLEVGGSIGSTNVTVLGTTDFGASLLHDLHAVADDGGG